MEIAATKMVEERPALDLRSEYVPRGTQDRYIVLLLRRTVEAGLQRHLRRGSRVLDLGCGRQPFRRAIEAAGCSYAGMDVQQNPENSVEFLGAADEPLGPQMSGRTFDFILCTEVLEHVADWEQAFANLHALLAPGGRVMITCPHFFALHEEPYDFWRPTLHAIAFYARRHELSVLERVAAGDAWDVLGTMLACCKPVPHRPGVGRRLAAGMLNMFRRAAAGALRFGIPQRLAAMSSPLYLSNYVVLERAAEKGTSS